MSLIIMIKNKATNGRPYDIYFKSIINSIEESVGEISNAFLFCKIASHLLFFNRFDYALG